MTDLQVGDLVYYSDTSEEEAVSDGDVGELLSIREGKVFPYEVEDSNWRCVVKYKPDEPTTTPPALETQVGGSHYRDMKIQPFEITFANFGYQGVRATIYNKVNKYLGRDKGDFDKHIEDIEKAIHSLQIQLNFAKQTQQEEQTNGKTT